jgi:hypothetical protein
MCAAGLTEPTGHGFSKYQKHVPPAGTAARNGAAPSFHFELQRSNSNALNHSETLRLLRATGIDL